MKKCAVNKNVRDFVNSKNRLTEEKLEELTKDLSNNSITNSLFGILREEIDDYNGRDKLDYLVDITNYIGEVLDLNPSINRKSITKKISKVYGVVETRIEEKYQDNKKASEELKKVLNALDKLEDNLENKDSLKYSYIDSIINDGRAINYIEEVFEGLHNAVNIRDRKGASLFNNMVSRYLEAIQDPENKQEEIEYFNTIIMIISAHKDFYLLNEDRKLCLLKAEAFLKNLKTKDKYYEKKKIYLDALVNNLSPYGNKDKNEVLDTLSSKYNINVKFDKDILDEIEFVKNRNSSLLAKDRYIVDEYSISIDSDHTNIMDDCISCRKLENGNYLLGIHIVDILGYFPFESNTIQEAINRVYPIHLDRDNKLPIMPEDLVKNYLSLNEGEERLATSYFYEITKDFEIVREKTLKTIVTNMQKFSFSDVERMFKEKELINSTLDTLFELNVGKKKHLGDKLISKTSLLVNQNIGEYFNNNGYPCIYVDEFIEDIEGKEIDKIRLKESKNCFTTTEYRDLKNISSNFVEKIKYSTEPGIDSKTTITSPLRKGSDILNRQALELCYFHNPSDLELQFLEETMKDSVSYMNKRLQDIDNFKTDYQMSLKKK